MTARVLDGSVWSQGGREWILHEDVDDDGRRFGWSECGTCGRTVLGGDDARTDHECPPPCPHCGDRSDDARIETVVYRHSGERSVSWRCCGTDVECEHGRLLADCPRPHGEP